MSPLAECVAVTPVANPTLTIDGMTSENVRSNASVSLSVLWSIVIVYVIWSPASIAPADTTFAMSTFGSMTSTSGAEAAGVSLAVPLSVHANAAELFSISPGLASPWFATMSCTKTV